MAISVVGVTPVGPTTLRVQFSEAFDVNDELYARHNYAFRTRFGIDIPIYTKLVEIVNTTTVELTLQDTMLLDGDYEILVAGVSAISDHIKIEDGPGPQTSPFLGVGEPKKCFDIRRRVPKWWDTKYGSSIHALLCSTGHLYDELGGESGSQVENVAEAVFIRTAIGEDLGVIGQNYGVQRPDYALGDDDLYRKLIPIFSTSRKAVLNVFYLALDAVFGPQSTAGWKIFVLSPNELTIQLPPDLYFAVSGIGGATYLHPDPYESGVSTGVGAGFLADTAKSWTINEWTGHNLIDSAAASFDIVSNTANQLNLAIGTPASGGYTIIDPAESYPPSYPGDYFLLDESIPGSTIDGNIIVLNESTTVLDISSQLKASGIKLNIMPGV